MQEYPYLVTVTFSDFVGCAIFDRIIAMLGSTYNMLHDVEWTSKYGIEVKLSALVTL